MILPNASENRNQLLAHGISNINDIENCGVHLLAAF
jgi:hypothetical protein